jgi:hypothetical protein
MADKKETLAVIIKERDDYRAAIVEFLDSYYYDVTAGDNADVSMLVDALGKKRLER